ncbi:hypothetical protein [Streptomyces sp. NPDC000410]|uniref:hypothetical protein n=1 Tax=Streptomyces sp. NPDC000410 TaxID=3154254 RepID=UPI003323349E
MTPRIRFPAYALALAAAVVPLSAPHASAGEPRAAAAVDCVGFVHENDTHHGIADCTNNTGGTIRFRAEVVCGLAFDVSGDWVTLGPGGYGQSHGHCPVYSTGVGGVGWTVENA